MAQPTLLDIAIRNADDGLVPMVELSLQTNPELALMPTMPFPGISFKTLQRLTIPLGGFRNSNEGKAAVKCTYVDKLVEAMVMDAATEVDKTVADSDVNGRDVFLADEGAGILEGQIRAACSQMYYGRLTTVATSVATGPTKGFPGLIEMYDSTNNVVATGGSGADCSSAWFLKFGRQFLQWVIGNDGDIALGEVQEVRLTDGSGNPYDGYRRPCLFRLGLQAVNPNAMVRIKNIEPHFPLTDDLLGAGLDKFPQGIVPDAIMMSRRSRRYLQQARTATNATGAPAPLPTEYEGIPIVTTDAIVNTENAD